MKKFKLINNKGSTLMIFIILLMFFILAATIAIDYAVVSISKAKLSAAVDAGTLAGAQVIFDGYDVSGSIDTLNTKSVVNDYIVNKNTRKLKNPPSIIVDTSEIREYLSVI